MGRLLMNCAYFYQRTIAVYTASIQEAVASPRPTVSNDNERTRLLDSGRTKDAKASESQNMSSM